MSLHRQGQLSARHIPRFLTVEGKCFRFKIDQLSSGGSILITEKATNRFFHLSIDIHCVRWLTKELGFILTSKDQTYFKIYRGDAYQVWIEWINSRNGEYLRLSKCIHGVVKAVIFPSDRTFEG